MLNSEASCLRLLAAAGLALALVGTGCSRNTATAESGKACCKAVQDDDEDEVEIQLGDLPASVRAALASVTTEAAVTKVVRETDDGRTKYEVEYAKNGAAWSADFSPTGTLLENEQEDGEDHD